MLRNSRGQDQSDPLSSEGQHLLLAHHLSKSTSIIPYSLVALLIAWDPDRGAGCRVQDHGFAPLIDGVKAGLRPKKGLVPARPPVAELVVRLPIHSPPAQGTRPRSSRPFCSFFSPAWVANRWQRVTWPPELVRPLARPRNRPSNNASDVFSRRFRNSFF